jgi:hypothetical protein
MKDDITQARLGSNIGKFAIADADDRVAEEIIKTLERNDRTGS